MCLFVAPKEICLANIFPALYTWTCKCTLQKQFWYNCILLVTLLDLHHFEGRLALKWRTAWGSHLFLQTARTFRYHKEGRECYLSTQLLTCSLLIPISLFLSPPARPGCSLKRSCVILLQATGWVASKLLLSFIPVFQMSSQSRLR